MHLQTSFRHHSYLSRASSASLSDHEDDDAITLVDEEYEHQLKEKPTQAQPKMVATTTAVASTPPPAFPSADFDNPFDNARLWRRMLALQRRYHCYNSARMSAALEDESVEAVVPPRACLDLLNDSMATQRLCDEARAEVAALLVLVPDRIRSRTSSYGEIVAGGCGENVGTTVTGHLQPTTTTATAATPTGSRSSRRQQERMQRRRVWRRRHDE